MMNGTDRQRNNTRLNLRQRNRIAGPSSSPNHQSVNQPTEQQEQQAVVGFHCTLCPKVVSTKTGLSNHMRTHRTVNVVPQPPPPPPVLSNKSSSDEEQNEIFECPYCDKSYPSKIGLGVHKSSKHPNEANAEKPASSKQPFSAEEIEIISNLEAEAIVKEEEIIKNGVSQVWKKVRYTNIYLKEKINHVRSIESLKGLRNKNASYRKKV